MQSRTSTKAEDQATFLKYSSCKMLLSYASTLCLVYEYRNSDQSYLRPNNFALLIYRKLLLPRQPISGTGPGRPEVQHVYFGYNSCLQLRHDTILARMDGLICNAGLTMTQR